MKKTSLTTTAMVVGLGMTASAISAQEVRFMCYSDGNECEVYDDLANRFEAENSGIDVIVDVVPYQAILENLPVQLAAGTGPDLAKVTDLGGLNEYYLDLTSYVDTAYWDDAFGETLNWYRVGERQGYYGMHSQLTITGPFVNATLFEQAGVDLPGEGATWDDWAAAASAVASATDADFPMAMDRSGHRVAGPGRDRLVVGIRAFREAPRLVMPVGLAYPVAGALRERVRAAEQECQREQEAGRTRPAP